MADTNTASLATRPASSLGSSNLSPRGSAAPRRPVGVLAALGRGAANLKRGVGNAGSMIKQNTQLRAALAAADPQSAPAVLAKALPEIGVNAGLSALDASDAGKAFAAVARVDASTATLFGSLIGLAFKVKGKFRKGLLKLALGSAHACASKYGSRLPGAVGLATDEVRAAKASQKTAGEAEETDSAPDAQ